MRPNLGKSWTISPENLTYRFALVTEARFHDGTSFDASHVAFSLDRLRAGDNPGKSRFAAIPAGHGR